VISLVSLLSLSKSVEFFSEGKEKHTAKQERSDSETLVSSDEPGCGQLKITLRIKHELTGQLRGLEDLAEDRTPIER